MGMAIGDDPALDRMIARAVQSHADVRIQLGMAQATLLELEAQLAACNSLVQTLERAMDPAGQLEPLVEDVWSGTPTANRARTQTVLANVDVRNARELAYAALQRLFNQTISQRELVGSLRASERAIGAQVRTLTAEQSAATPPPPSSVPVGSVGGPQ